MKIICKINDEILSELTYLFSYVKENYVVILGEKEFLIFSEEEAEEINKEIEEAELNKVSEFIILFSESQRKYFNSPKKFSEALESMKNG